MPKIKTPSAIKIRFRVTKTGKLLCRTQNMRHLRRKKRKGAIREARIPQVLTGKIANKIKRMLRAK